MCSGTRNVAGARCRPCTGWPLKDAPKGIPRRMDLIRVAGHRRRRLKRRVIKSTDAAVSDPDGSGKNSFPRVMRLNIRVCPPRSSAILGAVCSAPRYCRVLTWQSRGLPANRPGYSDASSSRPSGSRGEHVHQAVRRTRSRRGHVRPWRSAIMSGGARNMRVWRQNITVKPAGAVVRRRTLRSALHATSALSRGGRRVSVDLGIRWRCVCSASVFSWLFQGGPFGSSAIAATVIAGGTPGRRAMIRVAERT